MENLLLLYRISRYIFRELLNEIPSQLFQSTTRSHSMPPTTLLAVTLQFLATGSFQTVVASAQCISQTFASTCVTAVCDGSAAIAGRYIQFPSESLQIFIQESFHQRGGLPLAFGCTDGSHVAIIAPASNEEVYVKRKLFHSIKIQEISDHEFRFMDAVVMWPGSTHDAFI